MKRTFILLVALLPYLLSAQSPIKKRKYPSLLWEITGKGLKKPSYLFGTMHVSSKMAFHLADSFYLGIRNADMVALETNPESWQEDMSKYDLGDNDMNQYRFRLGGFLTVPSDYLSINTLKIFKYDKKIERALYSNSSTINNLLYRTYGNESSDFEEDTYLDMYIYQCGKKWGKRVAGVEKYGESMKLMMEAYKDAAKDKNKKERSYDTDNNFSNGKLQEAYRSGNLDWLDSINRYNSFSPAFDEKFLYKRNEIQASSIDSILKTGQSLFVGVGAAHLPGNRGVIEMLRDMGYKLRPVKMGERDSQHKNQVEKLRVPVTFSSQSSDDGIYKVDIPGKFYKYGDDPWLEQRQSADMANGSYYMVTRIMTNAWMWGHNTARVQRIVDSLLYENIPGRIVTKTNIVRNGYNGIDITNKTRRGDMQRYNIFVTPFEVIVFKMSGTGEYVQLGEEAKKFFGSIQLKEFKGAAEAASPVWKKYSPASGGFSVSMPHDPYVASNGSWVYDSEDKMTNTQYRVIRTDIHNYNFAEEDTFDLGLLDESFKASEFIDKQLSRKQTNYKGYPALDCQYKDKYGGVYSTRFIIQGPHYYTLVAHGKQETPAMKNFLNSFEIKPYIYGQIKERKDTALFYTVKSPVFPVEEKEKLDIPQYNAYSDDDDDDERGSDLLADGAFRTKTIANDTTGEKIYVSFFKSPRYVFIEDSSRLEKENPGSMFDGGDTSWIKRMVKKYELPNKTKVWEIVATDSGSSRTIWSKTFYKDGIGFAIVTESDTLSKPSSFVQSFFDSFTPIDTLTGTNPFKKKSAFFFTDFMNNDSVAHKRAVKNIAMIDLDSTDLPQLKKAIGFINWNEKKYLDTKKSLISKLEGFRTKAASDYLKELYYAAGDTIELQYNILETLLQQKTQYSYNLFRDMVMNEPPVLDMDDNNSNSYRQYLPINDLNPLAKRIRYNDGSFMDDLYDSLKLTRTILPDLLPLMNLDDYEGNMMHLLGKMVDSNLVKPKDYEVYFSKFLLEAKQELKKQAIAEKKKAIEKAEEAKAGEKNPYSLSLYSNDQKDHGNDDLGLYATLLLPFWDINPAVQPVIKQMLSCNDNRLKYNTMLLLIGKKKPYPDSLLKYFAKLDEYRYELYTDLNDLDQPEKFPTQYNNHLDLGKSKLLNESSYSKPDTLVYMDRLTAEVKGKKGFVYFYKYKNKKDDVAWKLASVGLVPEDPAVFEFDDDDDDPSPFNFAIYDEDDDAGSYKYDFTGLRNTRLREDDEPVINQLNKELKKMLYSKRKSAKQFYNRDISSVTYDETEMEDSDDGEEK